MKQNKTFIFCIVTVFITFVFYFPTIFYELKAYDEAFILKELHLPICTSIQEIFELISLLGIHQHLETSNTLYSNIDSLRCNPFGDLIHFFTLFFFKKNTICYHIYSLLLHLINTTLVWLILYTTITILKTNRTLEHTTHIVVSILTLIWSCHPVNVESVLLLSNYNPLLSYMLCFICTYVFLKSLNTFSFSLGNIMILFLIFFICILITEHNFILPLVLMAYSFGIYLYSSKSLANSFKLSFLKTLPLFIALFLFLLMFITSSAAKNLSEYNSLEANLERIFWLSPQILVHLIKLLFFPIILSIDQSLLVKTGKTLFDPYSIFCILTLAIFILFLIISLIKGKKHFPFLYIILFPFLISLLPFSQAVAPIYNLASERYLYFPSFLFIFGLSHLLITKADSKRLLILLMMILITYMTRAYIRTLDWKDSISLYRSAINSTDNPLFKGFRYEGLVTQDKLFSPYPHKEVNPVYINEAIKYFKRATAFYKQEVKKYQSNIPKIIKLYGLDPQAYLVKAGYFLAHSDFTLNEDPKRALKIIEPYFKDLSLFDKAPLSFYGSLLFYNDMLDKAEQIYRYALKKNSHSLRIVLPLSELIYIKYNDLNEVERLTLNSYKYFPYDSFTQRFLIKLYKLKGDYKKYAHFSYVYGSRNHSIKHLNDAYIIYSQMNKIEMARKAQEKIRLLEKLQGQNTNEKQ